MRKKSLKKAAGRSIISLKEKLTAPPKEKEKNQVLHWKNPGAEKGSDSIEIENTGDRWSPVFYDRSGVRRVHYKQCLWRPDGRIFILPTGRSAEYYTRRGWSESPPK